MVARVSRRKTGRGGLTIIPSLTARLTVIFGGPSSLSSAGLGWNLVGSVF